jgi:pimeloyl-ACP methyl ester carboxylesterase
MHVTRLLFLHANGYPAAVYRHFIESLSRAVEVVPVGILETSASTPAVLRWRRMRDQVVERLAALGDAPAGAVGAVDAAATSAVPASQPAEHRAGCTALVGHSMGGYLALMAAARQLPAPHPVVLIDSPLPGPGRAALLSLAQRTGLSYRMGPAPIAARRRHTWQDLEQARHFFAGKPFVQRWAPGVLDDFLAHALRSQTDAEPAPVTLRIPREEERDIYAHLPHREAARALQHLRTAGVPVGFVAGSQSAEMRMAGWQANRRLFRDRFITVETGHLVPLEAPADCAAAVLALLAALPER